MIGWRIPCFAIGQNEERDHGRMAASSRIDDERRRD
jgi:hypothetical protein